LILNDKRISARGALVVEEDEAVGVGGGVVHDQDKISNPHVILQNADFYYCR
jgi:hypothetical protein